MVPSPVFELEGLVEQVAGEVEEVGMAIMGMPLCAVIAMPCSSIAVLFVHNGTAHTTLL